VPGELIPSLYFDYVRSKDASHIYGVFTHNCHDILSLAVLTARAMEMLDESAPPEDPIDDYSLGRIFELASRPERSIKHYSRAVESGVGGAARRRALRGWAYQHKRRGEVTEAVELWKELAEEEGPEAVPAFEELAMVLEHRDHDFSGALDYCERALSRIEEDLRLPLQFRERWFEAFQHRRRRLERKIGRRQK
jgi:tetratricopeptide (TPR) repeat protein